MEAKYTYLNDLYEFSLEIVFTENFKQTIERYSIDWGIKGDSWDFEACVISKPATKNSHRSLGKYVIIYRREYLTENIISHEINHLTAFILEDRSIDLEGKNGDYENMSWLNGLLNEVVRQAVREEKIKLKKSKIPSVLIKE